MYRFTATPQIGVKTTHYAFADNDVNGSFGTDATATGVPIDPNHYTCAVPIGPSSSYRISVKAINCHSCSHLRLQPMRRSH